MIRVEMLSTGDEVLHGQIVDTNAAWLADVLFQHGLPMTSRSTVGDAMSSLVEALQSRSQIADVLIVNGGLGPTSDDPARRQRPPPAAANWCCSRRGWRRWKLVCQPRAAHGTQ